MRPPWAFPELALLSRIKKKNGQPSAGKEKWESVFWVTGDFFIPGGRPVEFGKSES